MLLQVKTRDVATFLWSCSCGKGGSHEAVTLALREGRRDWSSDRGAICSNITSLTTSGRHQPLRIYHASRHHGARSSAASAVAGTAARCQWPRPTRPESAISAAPRAAIPDIARSPRCLCDTGHTIPVLSVPGRHLGGHTQGRAEEEDVISEEATTVHGGEGTERHCCTGQMLGVWAREAEPHTMSILC